VRCRRASGGLISTASDYAVFLQTSLNGDGSYSHDRLTRMSAPLGTTNAYENGVGVWRGK
jgi:CubicO group peptidase (beta-lactamase class C family)